MPVSQKVRPWRAHGLAIVPIVGEGAFGQADTEVMVAPPPTVKGRLKGLQFVALGIDGMRGGVGLSKVEQLAHQLVGDEGGLICPGEDPAIDAEEVRADALNPAREEALGVVLDVGATTGPALGFPGAQQAAEELTPGGSAIELFGIRPARIWVLDGPEARMDAGKAVLSAGVIAVAQADEVDLSGLEVGDGFAQLRFHRVGADADREVIFQHEHIIGLQRLPNPTEPALDAEVILAVDMTQAEGIHQRAELWSGTLDTDDHLIEEAVETVFDVALDGMARGLGGFETEDSQAHGLTVGRAETEG